MTKSFTNQEFIDYVCGLEFTDFGDMLVFVKSYQDHYHNMNADLDRDGYVDAMHKYLAVMHQFGPSLLKFAEDIWKKVNEDEKAH